MDPLTAERFCTGGVLGKPPPNNVDGPTALAMGLGEPDTTMEQRRARLEEWGAKEGDDADTAD